MRTIDNSKVGLAGEKYSPCQTRPDDNDRFDAEEVVKLSGSPQPFEGLISKKDYRELFRISDEMINLEAKNLLCDSGCFLPDSEEDETSLDSGNGTRSDETTDPDSEGQDDVDLEDAEGGILKMPDNDFFASHDAEDPSVDSCEMKYVELDLSSQSLPDDMELMMKNLQIGSIQDSAHPDSPNFDSSDVTPTPVNVCDDSFVEKNDANLSLDEIPEKQFSKLHNDVKSDGATNFIHSSEDEYASSNRKPETTHQFFGSFLPSSESSLGSLPEKTYMQIAEHLLDEQTLLKLNAEENNSCCTTSNTCDIPFVSSEMESSNEDVKSSFAPDEMDPTDKICPMTFVDLDIDDPEDITLKMLNNLNIKDDKIPLCRGNPSDQNAIQTHSLCSGIDGSDFEVPSVDLIDDSPFLIDRVHSDMDFNFSFTNICNGSSISAFNSSQTFPSFGAEHDFSSTVCLPPFSNDRVTKTFNTSPEVRTVERIPPEISSPRCSVLPPVASSIPVLDSAFDESFFDGSLENGETSFEHKFVTENLDRLEEISEFLGLSNPETKSAVTPPTSLLPPLSNNTVFSRPTCLTNLPPLENPFPTNLGSNVVTRVTTQTLSTQSEAIPAVPSFLFLLATTRPINGHKRPTCNEMSEPAKKPFGFDNFNNLGLSEADLRKKAKEEVASLTDEQLFQFTNNESCLHRAVKTKNPEYVLVLLKRLKNFDPYHQNIINSKNEKSQTPLHLAVQANIPAIVHVLIKNGAEVNHLAETPSKKFESPLHYVASRGNHFKLVLKCLLKANDLDIDIKNSEGQTALHCAAVAHGTGDSNSNSIDSEYIIKKLLENADPLIQDNNGKNVLMYAIESKDLNLVSSIMRHMKTDCRDKIQQLLTATSLNGQTCPSLAYSLKEQFTQFQFDKLINILTSND